MSDKITFELSHGDVRELVGEKLREVAKDYFSQHLAHAELEKSIKDAFGRSFIDAKSDMIQVAIQAAINRVMETAIYEAMSENGVAETIKQAAVDYMETDEFNLYIAEKARDNVKSNIGYIS